jgi:hypothetical protein
MAPDQSVKFACGLKDTELVWSLNVLKSFKCMPVPEWDIYIYIILHQQRKPITTPPLIYHGNPRCQAIECMMIDQHSCYAVLPCPGGREKSDVIRIIQKEGIERGTFTSILPHTLVWVISVVGQACCTISSQGSPTERHIWITRESLHFRCSQIRIGRPTGLPLCCISWSLRARLVIHSLNCAHKLQSFWRNGLFHPHSKTRELLNGYFSCKTWDFHRGDHKECRFLGYKNPVRTSQETHYVSATESSQLLLCKTWDFHGGDYKECRLQGYKNPVRTSQETHYLSATEPSQLMLCTIWGFHGSDYEECSLLGYKNPVRTSQETLYVSATESSLLMLCKIWGLHGSNYEECRLLGCGAVWLL